MSVLIRILQAYSVQIAAGFPGSFADHSSRYPNLSRSCRRHIRSTACEPCVSGILNGAVGYIRRGHRIGGCRCARLHIRQLVGIICLFSLRIVAEQYYGRSLHPSLIIVLDAVSICILPDVISDCHAVLKCQHSGIPQHVAF